MQSNFIARKDSIILTAIDIINEGGLQSLSIREIAKRQDMGESLLYKHFKNKEEVIVAVLKYYSRFDTAIMNTIIKSDISSKKKIIYSARSLIEYYENYPAITAIMNLYEPLLHEDGASAIIIEIFNSRLNYVSRLIEEGQSKGEISNFFTPDELSEIIIGHARMSILKWRLNNYNFSLKDHIVLILDKLLQRL